MGTVFIQDLAVVMLVAGIVGVVCQRLHLSVVVGFLLAGVVIGPYTPPFQLVTDLDRVQMLADVGLVFLIFAIGLDLNLKRIQRLGFSIALATFLSAILILGFGRLAGLALGWSATESLFLASILMVSSSAIISKVLDELGLSHERSAQLALGVTVLEDTVAVVMLTLLTSVIRFGEADVGQVLPTIGALGAFVLVLFFSALFFVPRLLDWIERRASAEIRNIVLLGVVFGLSWLAVRVGYSLASAAFVLGAVVGSTRHKRDVERTLEGLRQLFGAVFFVAMGMLLDVKILFEALPWIAFFSAFTLIARITCSTLGLLSIGSTLRDALRAGLTLTPIGEFSFIIAQLGVASGAVPRSFFPMAVGVSVVTALVGPLLTRHSATIAAKIEDRVPGPFKDWLRFYHDAFVERLARPGQSARSRESLAHLLPAAAQLAFSSALLLFIEPLYAYAAAQLGEDWLFPSGLKVITGIVLGLLLLPPIFAAWRHISVFGTLIVGRVTSPDGGASDGRSIALRVAFRAVVGIFLAAWSLALLPFGFSVLWSVAFVTATLLALAFGLLRPIFHLHARVEAEVRDQLHAAQSPPGAVRLARALKERPSEWGVRLEEIVLPEYAPYAGKTIGELEIRSRFGSSVVGIERQGFAILNPSRDEVLYPGDRVLLLGTMGQLDEAESFFESSAGATARGGGFEDLTIESHVVPEDSPITEGSLLELDMIRSFGVQIGGVRRKEQQLPPPSGATRVAPHDEVLLVGTPLAIREFLAWLNRGENPDRTRT